MTIRWSAQVDDRTVEVAIQANATLAEALTLADIVANKSACSEGTCGACSVLVDGRHMLACITPALRCEGAHIQTAVSFADGPIAANLVASGGLQCGFCTPGMVIALHGLAVSDAPPQTIAALRSALDSNLCRCTGYAQLLRGGLAGIAELTGDARLTEHAKLIEERRR